MIAAKQNQKFPFHFLSAPPTPPAVEKKKGKENFWFLLPRPKGADEARRLERTIQFRKLRFKRHHLSFFAISRFPCVDKVFHKDLGKPASGLS